MTDASDDRRRTRRAVLAGTAGAVATPALTGAVTARGSTQASRQFVFETPKDFSGELEGNWLVVADQVDDVDTSGVGGCTNANWSPDESRAYEAVLTDKLERDPKGAEVQLVSAASGDDIESGQVFQISSAKDCANGYVTVDAVVVPEEKMPEGTETTVPNTADGSQGPLPGFTSTGSFAALATLVGWARWRD
ncbi:hypothetical protein [Haloarchaeobius sp. TZWWS8]|uniref:hypothetical protein n=1 Tax=Haloarchaeobius sp. TZWWS8 TaxID=3446121 RepID=UPI003EC1147B